MTGLIERLRHAVADLPSPPPPADVQTWLEREVGQRCAEMLPLGWLPYVDVATHTVAIYDHFLGRTVAHVPLPVPLAHLVADRYLVRPSDAQIRSLILRQI